MERLLRFTRRILRFTGKRLDTAFYFAQLYMTKNYVMYKKYGLLLLLTALLVTSRAQQNNLSFSGGVQHTWLLDKQASPLAYQTSEKTFTALLERELQGARIQIHLDGAIGALSPLGLPGRQLYDPGFNSDGSAKTDSVPLTGTFYNIKARFGWSKKVSSGCRTLFGKALHSNNHLGASLNDQLFYTDNFVRTGWLNSLSLNAEFAHAAILHEKHLLSLKVSVPLLALNTRLPYHNTISSPTGDQELVTFFKQGSRFTTLAGYQNLQLSAGYRYKLNKKFAVGVEYTGQWLHYKYVKPITLYQRRFGLSASFLY